MVLQLSELREVLIRLEETIIFALIERGQFALNAKIYQPGGLEVPKTNLTNPSFLDFFFCEIEKVHALCRRYTSPDEHPFFPESLPTPVLPLLNFNQVLNPNTINLNEKIKRIYIDKLLPKVCEGGPVDDQQYGSASNADVAVLQALSKRIHYGKFIAEAKFSAEVDKYTDLIRRADTDGIMKSLTDSAVEERLLARIRLKASTYGKEIGQAPTSDTDYKVSPDVLVEMYRDHIIPLTKEVEVLYLMQRLDGPSVAFLGPNGTFSEQVAQIWVKNSTSSSTRCELKPCKDVKDIFEMVLSNKAVSGVIPIENSQTGIIHPHLELIIRSDLITCAEIYLPIRFSLLSKSKATDVKKIYSHAQGLQQCQRYLKSTYPSAELIATHSTSNAAAAAASEEGVAVVASPAASQLYNLPVLAANIQDTETNTTRFLIVSKHIGESSGNDKTLLTLGTKNAPGSLSSVLNVLSKHKINLSSIESYPDKSRDFAYGFFVEFQGHVKDVNVKAALEEIEAFTTFINVKGSFPCANASPIVK